MYKIQKEAWFYSNPKDYALGKPSDKYSTGNAVISLIYNDIIKEKKIRWDSWVLYERKVFASKKDIENILSELPIDMPFELREKSYRNIYGTTQKEVFDSLNDSMDYNDLKVLNNPIKKYELVLPVDALFDSDRLYYPNGIKDEDIKKDGKLILDALKNIGFNIILRDEYYEGSITYESHSIKFQINADNLASFKDFFGKEIKPGDKVAWAESKKQIITGKVVEIFSDKVKINTEMGWAGSGFRDINFALKEYSFIKI